MADLACVGQSGSDDEHSGNEIDVDQNSADGSEDEYSGNESEVDQNSADWPEYTWRAICNCDAQCMQDCSCEESPLKFAFQDGKWHDDVQKLINELAALKLLDIDALSDEAHFALETLPVNFAIHCLHKCRREHTDTSIFVICEAERLRKSNRLSPHDDPDVYRMRVKANVCNGSDAVSAPLVVCTGGPAQRGSGDSVGEKRKRLPALAVLKKRLKSNKAAIDKNTAEFKANRAAAVKLKTDRKAMLEAIGVATDKAKSKTDKRKAKKAKQQKH